VSPDRNGHRSEILAVAKRLFMTRGYRGVSTREIAEAVGITQPALYHHFGGKEALYMAVLEEELASQSAAMWAAVRLEAPAMERLAALAGAIAARSEYDMSQMFHDLRFEISEDNRQRIGGAFAEAMMAPMGAVLEALDREGVIETPDAAGMTRAEMVMFVLSVIRMLTEVAGGPARGPERSPDEIGALTARIVLNGIGPRSAER
jgi:AcrR family transcriptional regulator